MGAYQKPNCNMKLALKPLGLKSYTGSLALHFAADGNTSSYVTEIRYNLIAELSAAF